MDTDLIYPVHSLGLKAIGLKRLETRYANLLSRLNGFRRA
jgi:hypothetical protein